MSDIIVSALMTTAFCFVIWDLPTQNYAAALLLFVANAYVYPRCVGDKS